MIATDYPLLDVVWSMTIFFVLVLWVTVLFKVLGDIFRRHDLSAVVKAGWLVLTILLPFLGVFVYMITQNDGMTQREIDRVPAAGRGTTAEIDRTRHLLDSGAITQAEFDVLDQKAFA